MILMKNNIKLSEEILSTLYLCDWTILLFICNTLLVYIKLMSALMGYQDPPIWKYCELKLTLTQKWEPQHPIVCASKEYIYSVDVA